jgi:alkanesulfonate monooxygenase SsuD/methylene tetrahydromethanopterin reductase-like flavin-dependent oxidoreductase (luciferase family)
MKIGYKLIAEAHSPQEMVRQAVRAEEAGFDFVEISDHFHPGSTARATPALPGRSFLRRPCAPKASNSSPELPVLSSVTTPR